MEERGRRLVEQLADGAYEAAVEGFDARMASALPPRKLAEVWDGLEAQIGPFQAIESVRTVVEGGYDVAFVTCAFRRARLDAKVVYARDGQVAGLFFVPPSPEEAEETTPSYVRSEAFSEQEVEVGTVWPLPGTLSLPADEAPVPGVVLVHGSGPNDRDQQVGRTPMFRDLAWGLASRGVAVLRYDKRTRVHAARFLKEVPAYTVKDETIDDAVEAVALLRGRREVDPDRVFVIGHSLGAMVGPRIAERVPELAGLALLAGNTRPLPEVVLAQVQYLAQLDGELDEPEAAQIAAVEAFGETVFSPSLTPETEVELLGTTTPGSYWLDLRAYDPSATARSLDLPMFVAQGGRDYQVTEKDFAGWKQALDGRSDVVLRLYPSLDHRFVEGTGASTPTDYDQPGDHVAEAVVSDLAAWILGRSHEAVR